MKVSAKKHFAIQEAFEAISMGCFTHVEVELLLQRLREALPEGPLRDIAHFLAHEERDRGIVFSATEYMYAHVSMAIGGQNSNVDLATIPGPLFRALLRNIQRAEIDAQRAPFVDKRAVLEELQQSYKLDQPSDSYVLPGMALSADSFKALVWAGKWFCSEAAFTSADVIESLRRTLCGLGIPHAKSTLARTRHEIILCILALLHHTRLRLPDGHKGVLTVRELLEEPRQTSQRYLQLYSTFAFGTRGQSGTFAVMATRVIGRDFASDADIARLNAGTCVELMIFRDENSKLRLSCRGTPHSAQ